MQQDTGFFQDASGTLVATADVYILKMVAVAVIVCPVRHLHAVPEGNNGY